MRGFKGETVETRQDHEKHMFVATDGQDRFWTHCAVCGADNDGWWQGGVPRYSGGHVHARVNRDGYGPEDVVVACLCFVGRFRRERNLGCSLDELDASAEFITQPLAIEWKRGDSRGAPPKVGREQDAPEVRGMTRVQFDRFLAKELTMEQLSVNLDAIRKKAMKGGLIPSLNQIMRDPPLRALYFGRNEQRNSGPPPVRNTSTPYKDD